MTNLEENYNLLKNLRKGNKYKVKLFMEDPDHWGGDMRRWMGKELTLKDAGPCTDYGARLRFEECSHYFWLPSDIETNSAKQNTDPNWLFIKKGGFK